MKANIQRYGTELRIYDNGGRTLDRYTIIPPRYAKGYREGNLWDAIASSEYPFHSFGMHVSAIPGHHLGKRIHWNELPDDVKTFANKSFPEYKGQYNE